MIEDSGLYYPLLCPDWFTNGNEVDYALTQKSGPKTGTAVSRKSNATFPAALFESPDLYLNEHLGINKPA